ncbi:MAG TPA: hypothetical protein VLW17_08205 [Thermoanaerobaculaceae bacterium]|nr:hypothetical protein [Thermoanaerobaculaceae bacterium]
MKPRIAHAAAFGLIALLLMSSCIVAPYAPEGPPTPYAEAQVVAPSPGFVWIGGYWGWSNRWIWHSGYWARPPRVGAVWVAGRWNRGARGWRWTPGRWRR